MKNKKIKKSIIKGRFYKINKKIKRKITAKYHKIKDWKMDPKGYFLISINRKKKFIKVGYCKFKKLKHTTMNEMVAIIEGKTALEIVNTLIREKFISTLQHAGDMGIELYKAELSMKYGLKYIQDKDLELN
jgi:dihydropteroate synthase